MTKATINAEASKCRTGIGAAPLRSALWSGRLNGSGAVVALGALLAFLTLYPLGMLLYGSLHSTPPGVAGEFNLDGYRGMATTENAIILVNTTSMALINTGISMTLAILLAWIVARTDTPASRVLETLITLPFFVPPILTAMAWGMLGNPQVGAINSFWRWLTGTNTTIINVYSYFGVVWHMMQYATTFLFLFIVDAFRAMDPAMEESSRMSGASRWTTFRHITLMLMLPVTTSGFLLSFIRGIESFESPLFFGTPVGINVITTQIYNAVNQRATPDYQYATALAFSVMALMFLLVLTQWRILHGRNFTTVTGKGYRPNVARLGPWRWATFAFCMLFFIITVALPIGQLLVGSFFKFFGFYKLNMLTLDNYAKVLRNDEFWRGFKNTLMLGLAGASITMVLGGLIAYVTTRTKLHGRRIIEAMAWMPWMMPGIVLGIGFLWGFAMLPGPIPIYGTVWALLLAYMTLYTPISVRVMSAAYSQLAFDLEECSRVHGASWWQTFWRILIALAWPSFAVGWVLVFFGILRELSASILLFSAGSEVLSVVVLKLWTNGRAEEVCVIGIFMMTLVLLFRWAQSRFIRRHSSTLRSA